MLSVEIWRRFFLLVLNGQNATIQGETPITSLFAALVILSIYSADTLNDAIRYSSIAILYTRERNAIGFGERLDKLKLSANLHSIYFLLHTVITRQILSFEINYHVIEFTWIAHRLRTSGLAQANQMCSRDNFLWFKTTDLKVHLQSLSALLFVVLDINRQSCLQSYGSALCQCHKYDVWFKCSRIYWLNSCCKNFQIHTMVIFLQKKTVILLHFN